MQNKNKQIELGVIIAVFAMLIDQLHKFYMIEIFDMPSKGTIQVTSFFNLVMVWNKGISFGMFQNFEKSNYFFLGFSSIIVLLIFYMLSKSANKIESVAFGLVIGGALGNIIDRIRYNAVADFFDFHVANKHWPAFNIADSCVFCGAALLIIASLFNFNKNSKHNKINKEGNNEN
jgi:signal peptidase II